MDAALNAAFEEYNNFGLAQQSQQFKLAEREMYGIKEHPRARTGSRSTQELALLALPKSFNPVLLQTSGVHCCTVAGVDKDPKARLKTPLGFRV